MLTKKYTTEINTERLQMRRFLMSDAEAVYRNWASDPDVQLNYGEPVCETWESVSALLEKYIGKYDEPYYYRWAITEKGSDECIGQICCRTDNHKSRKVIEKCGFTYEGTLRDYFKMNESEFEGRMYYSILRDEELNR